MARCEISKEEIRHKTNKNYYNLDFAIDEIRDTYEFNETCQDTVPEEIVAFLESCSFEDAIRTAISIGGYSDTLATNYRLYCRSILWSPGEYQTKGTYLSG